MPYPPTWPNPWGSGDPKPQPGLPWENPEGSVPADAYKYACCNDPFRPLTFAIPTSNQYGDATGVVGRAVYFSPVFDFRPELKGLFGPTPTAQPIRGRSGSYGAGIYLTMQFVGVAATAALNIRVWSLEYGHIFDPAGLQLLGTREDATGEFYDASGTSGEANSCVITLSAPEGLRFWRGGLCVDYTTGTIDDAPTSLLIGSFCG